MARQKERDAGNKFSTSEITLTQDFFTYQQFYHVLFLQPQWTKDKCPGRWETTYVENAASLFILVLYHHTSRNAASTALLTQNVL